MFFSTAVYIFSLVYFLIFSLVLVILLCAIVIFMRFSNTPDYPI